MSDSPLDLVIRNGTVVTAETQGIADVGIRDGQIVQLGGPMSGRQELDAAGTLVMPGGVDPHVHLHIEDVDPGEPVWVDDYTSGSAAALAGGITSLGNMAFVLPWESLKDRIIAESAAITREAICDIFFHLAVTCPSDAIAAELPRAVAAGHSSVKFFMCMPSFDGFVREFTQIMRVAADAKAMTLIHCEDLSTIECCTSMLSHQSKTSLHHYAESRPPVSEVIATQRALEMCRVTGAPTYIVHLSSARALDLCRAARAEGLPVFVETRPLYLYLTAERYADPDGALYVAQPPLRQRTDIDALWSGLVDGSIDTLGSDHAPWTHQLKTDPKLRVNSARPGVAELDTMLPLLYTEGVAKNRISPQRFVALTSTNAARLFGLYPRKGTIAVGSDADVVIWEIAQRRVLRNSDLHSRAAHSVYEGRELSGWPRTTIRRGEIVFDRGRVLGQAGSGQVLQRGPSGPSPRR